MSTSKPRLIKDFEKLTEDLQEQIKLQYPKGFFKYLVDYYDREGNKKSALPFETEDIFYLVKMTPVEAKKIVDDDDDYDSSGNLKKSVKDDYEDKYSDIDDIGESDESGDYDDYTGSASDDDF